MRQKCTFYFYKMVYLQDQVLGKKKRQDSVPDDDDEDQNLLYYSSDDTDSEENIDLGQNEKLDQEKVI